MPTTADSQADVDRLWTTATHCRKAGDDPGEVHALEALLAHPCAHHLVDASECYDQLYHAHRRAGRYDEAIDARRRSMEAGYRSEPHPEADIAECYAKLGRLDEAQRLFEDLRLRTPDDVWLFNAAGLTYREIGNDEEALRWFLDGIDVAIRTGDRDQVIGQLMGFVEEQWDRLDLPADESLVLQVERFRAQWKEPPWRERWGAVHRDVRRCDHCGFDPKAPVAAPPLHSVRRAAVGSPPRRAPHSPDRARPRVIALAWFPAREWSLAVEHWPDLLDELPRDHNAYSRIFEGKLKRFAKATGVPLSIAALNVAELIDFAGDEPADATKRSLLAAEMARTGRTAAWPPGRNDSCWCGSTRKYKQCCGPVPAAPEEP